MRFADDRFQSLGLKAFSRPISWRDFWSIFKQAGGAWWDDKVPRLGAAVAYYTVFSLAPLLMIVIAVAGMFFGRDAAQHRIIGEIGSLVGYDAAAAIESILASSIKPGGGMAATIIGIVVLLIGSLSVFVEMQDALNTIWRVKPKSVAAFRSMLRDRWVSFSLLLSIGFLLLVSLVLSAAIAALTEYFSVLQFVQVIDAGISFFIYAVLFALIFKILPDVRIPWSNIWMGSAVTSTLFNIGRLLISLYLAKSNLASVWGAAASIVIVLVWIYFSAQILFFGSEFIRAYANHFGSPVIPKTYATAIE